MTASFQREASLRRGLADSTDRLYLRPLGLLEGEAAEASIAAGLAIRLAGAARAFSLADLYLRRADGRITAIAATPLQLRDWAADEGLTDKVEAWFARLSMPRPDFAGLAMDRPQIMGVVNVTPDSFSDGGDFLDPDRAIRQAQALAEAGASILDIGGESTRPGSAEVPADEEQARVVPVIRALAGSGAAISIDSRRAFVMAAALDAGAGIVNDVTALTGDPGTGDTGSLDLVAARQAPTILMHMRGTPQTMQNDPDYRFAPLDIYDYLEARVEACLAAGLPLSHIAIDPGIGFGKTVRHNLELLSHLALFHGLGCPVLLGVSRKGFIGKLSRGEEPKRRVPGSLAAALEGARQGVQMIRVHDVDETRQALAIAGAIAD
ncbi:dihydropteroate synthase [Oceanibaculum sp.]|uniref:dihydropteroate synthase n=1 Tax=Oceanibaculum sp. TaxID=1903597 RepID=UPI002590DA44|nr:dihydropteroate synthase [Oceanibaculum sp.]MCH2394780.1 dihydropteroate synthase [Oceanibaculum sp.]